MNSNVQTPVPLFHIPILFPPSFLPFTPCSCKPQYAVSESLKLGRTVGEAVMDVSGIIHGRHFPDQAKLEKDPKLLLHVRVFGKVN